MIGELLYNSVFIEGICIILAGVFYIYLDENFRRSEDTRSKKCQSYLAICRRYDISSIVMRANQIWISTAL